MKKTYALLLCMFLTGCASLNPYLRDFNFISLSQEKALSEGLAASIAETQALAGNTAETRAVQALGEQLVAALPARELDYEFFVVANDTPNAFTIPGGKIYVHTGLLKMADREELAGVLAHEIGHAYERHPAKGLSRAYGVSFLSQLVLNKTGQENKFKVIALKLAGQGVLNKYGRDDEREADDISLLLLRKTGFSTSGLIGFLSKLQALEAGSPGVPVFLRTHPPTAERIERLRAQIDTPAAR